MKKPSSEEQYLSRFPKSQALYEKAKSTFARGVTHDSWFLLPFPIFIRQAKGAYEWDADGFEYIDYFGGHGTLLLGHSHPSLVEAVQSQILKGTHYGAGNEAQLEWAELVKFVSSEYDVYQVDRIEQNAPVWDASTGNLPPTATDPARTIPGARQELRGVEWRKSMALMKVAGKYLGTNTGFLPMANAFGANHFVFHDSRFILPSEWEYPDNHNFYQTDSMDSIKERIKQHWLN